MQATARAGDRYAPESFEPELMYRMATLISDDLYELAVAVADWKAS